MINPTQKGIMMKKSSKIILIGSIFFLSLSSQRGFAQTEIDSGVKDAIIRIGAKVGMNFSAFAVDFENVTDSKKGLIVGGFASYRLLSFLTVQGELLYQQNGAANMNKQTVNQITTFQNIIQHNIQLPVFAMLTVPGYPADNPIIPYISLGADYSFNMQTFSINKSQTSFDDGSSFRTTSFTNVSSQYLQNEIGAMFGGGFLMKTEGWMYTIDFRYRFGMTNINNVRPDNPGNDFSVNYASITVGVAFF